MRQFHLHPYTLPTLHHNYRIAEKLLRGENFSEFRSFVAIRESFLCEIWGHGVLWHSMSEQSTKVFSEKIVFSPICTSFSPLKVSRYTVQCAG